MAVDPRALVTDTKGRDLADRADHRRLGRLITRIENSAEEAAAILREVWSRTGGAHRIGVTGPPGVGKSTLVDQLIAAARSEGLAVAVLAVDPSSPFSGGAILGDRVRMLRHSGDPHVFIRSMADRSHPGGLAAATQDVAHLLDACGFHVVVLETVGVGQNELEIMEAADTVVLVTVPGLGDSVQMLKAGVLEIADVLVVNKADRPGTKETVLQLREMRQLAPRKPGWEPPILATVAHDGTGTEELWRAVRLHWSFLQDSGELAVRRSRRAERQVLEIVERALAVHLRSRLAQQARLGAILAAAKRGEQDPHSAAAAIIAGFLAG